MMLKAFFELWGAVQQLLIQVGAIRGSVQDDVVVIKRSLEIYKNLLSYGLTDSKIDNLIQDLGRNK